MRYTLLLALVISCTLLAVSADLRIDMVYYDPFTSRGSEAVLIANTGSYKIDLTGYKLATRTSPQDHTLQGSIAPFGTYLSAYTGWSDHKDNSSWPNADHEQAITLANAGGYVHLTTPEGEVLDTVGWKNTEYYLGTPHPGAAKGMALVRVQDTQNNSADFAELTPFTQVNTQEHEGVALEFVVQAVAPRILDIAVEDDFPDRAGVQLLPLSDERSVWVNITVEHNNTLLHTNVSVNGVVLEGNTSATVSTFSGHVPISPHTHVLNITIQDETHHVTERVELELLAAASLSLPETLTEEVRPGQALNTTLIVENTGAAPVHLHIHGMPPRRAGQLLGRVTYEIHHEAFNLTQDVRKHEVSLQPGQQLAITVRTHASFVPAGSYTGQLVIAGVLA